MNRSADWLHQAQADLAQAQLSAGAGHHEWACFACHQAEDRLRIHDALCHARALLDAIRSALAPA